MEKPPVGETPAAETPAETPPAEAPAEDAPVAEEKSKSESAETVEPADVSPEPIVEVALKTTTPAAMARTLAAPAPAAAAATTTATKPTLAEQIQQLLGSLTLPEYPNVPGATPAMVAGAVVVGLANVLTATLAGGVTAPLAIPVFGLLVAAYQRFIVIGTNAVPIAQVVSTGQTVGTAFGAIKVIDPNGDPFAVTVDQVPSKGIVTLLPDLLDSSKYTYTYTPTSLAMLAHGGTDTFTIKLDDTAGIQSHPLGPHVTTKVITVNYVGAGNNVPSGTIALGTADVAGIIRGNVNAIDGDGDPLSYTLVNSSNPADASANSSYTSNGGIVNVGSDGSFTYIPKNNGLLAYSDSFTVTVSDGYGGVKDINVPILLTNSSAGTSTTGTDSSTGAVSGKLVYGLFNNDLPDNDKSLLAFGAGTGPAYGSVDVKADGTYTYTPTAAARHAAAGNGPDEDTFTILGIDAAGRSVKMATVTVDISPKNTAPANGTVTITNVNTSNGTVTGTITGTDADGDPISFSSGSIITPGTVVGWTGNMAISSNGNFTYTINALTGDTARHNAAKDNATDAEKYDTVTVQMADGYGGTTNVQVKVPIAPKNTNPVMTTGVAPLVKTKTATWTFVVPTDADLDGLDWVLTKAPATGSVTWLAGAVTYTSTGGGIVSKGPSDSFEITVKDGHGGSDAKTFTY